MKNIKKLNSRKIGIGPMSSEVIEAVYKYSSINNKELIEYSKSTTSYMWAKLSLNPKNKLEKIRSIGTANIMAMKLVKIFQIF